MNPSNIYEDLSDYENMIAEDEVESSFFIDRPPTAQFVPDSPGHDKTTVLDDRREPHLFDFELEVEPILQVLVGKALETAKIEVIETVERDRLEKHRSKF